MRAALERQKEASATGRSLPIGEILIEMGFLTRTQLSRLQGNSEDSGGNPAQQIPGYQLRRKIGAGAMAIVYQAKQTSLDRTVAVKVLPKRLSLNPEFVERFYREGKAAAALSHNNIVQAIDVGEAGGYHYFVMEFVEGKTVYDFFASGEVFEEKEAVRVMRQVAAALAHAHERGIIHRDVKPKNIMITKEGVVKLADMGLARATSDVEAAIAEAGRAYGTPYYISPEQIRGEVTIDARADIYSLGATWYHMMTGRVPFEGPTPAAVMHKHLKETLTPPDHINMKLTAGCAAMIEIMMAKKAKDRYPSCRELIEDLELLTEGHPPKYAQQHLDHSMFDELSHGEAQETMRQPVVSSRPAGPPIWLVALLGAVSAISIVVNIILLSLS
jgi:serine/threonine-protein kinase